MAFQAWLLKVGDTDISKYVDIETYKVSPDQRADLDSDRNGLNILYREVADHYTTKIEFNTIPTSNGKSVHKGEGKKGYCNLFRCKYRRI